MPGRITRFSPFYADSVCEWFEETYLKEQEHYLGLPMDDTTLYNHLAVYERVGITRIDAVPCHLH